MKNNSNDYPWQAMLAVSAMGIMGIVFIGVMGFFNVTSFEEFYDCFYKNGMALIFCIFFIVISIICWISFFLNVIVKPKKEILYLSKIEDGSSVFINKKGKKFYFDDAKYKEKKYYYVLKTHGDIKKVLNETDGSFDTTKEKKSYWLNFYSPAGNFENIFLLPIVYVIFLPGFLSILISKGYDKIFGVIWCLIPGYVIIYDLIYKIKLKKNNYKKIDESAFHASYSALKMGIALSVIVITDIIFIYLFLKSDGIGKIIMLLFCLCALCTSGYLISELLDNDKMKKIFKKGYLIIFILFMSKMINTAIVEVIIAKEYMSLLFLAPFWIALIYLIYRLIKK